MISTQKGKINSGCCIKLKFEVNCVINFTKDEIFFLNFSNISNKDPKNMVSFFQILGNRSERLGCFSEGETKYVEKQIMVFYPGVYNIDNFRINNLKKENFTNLNTSEQALITVNGK